jgi:predicted dehydrogenase
VYLVEKNADRTSYLLAKYPFIKRTISDYKEIIANINVAILALPNFLHAPVAIDFISRGVPVFIEKPLAINYEEGLKVAELATKLNVPIGVGLVKRFYESSVLIKKMIDAELFGKVRSVLISDGNEFAWPLQSDSLIDKKKSGGGVLIDSGAHLLDLACWWLGKGKVISYADDNCGNIETECDLKILMGDVQVHVELSRLRKLQQKIEIRFERGLLQYCFKERKPSLKFLADSMGSFVIPIEIKDDLRTAFRHQIEAFFAQCNFQKNKPVETGANIMGLESLELIFECYGYRK